MGFALSGKFSFPRRSYLMHLVCLFFSARGIITVTSPVCFLYFNDKNLHAKFSGFFLSGRWQTCLTECIQYWNNVFGGS